MLHRFVCVLAIIAGTGLVRAEGEEPAIAAITKLTGSVERDKQAPGKPVVGVTLKLVEMRNADLKHLTAFPRLRSLSLMGSSVGDEGISHLTGLRELHTLDLGATLVTDIATKSIAQLKTLESLSLAATEITDVGLARLGTLTELRVLALQDTSLHGDDLKHLASLKKLRTLRLSTEQLNDRTLRALRQADQLHALEQATAKGGGRPTSARDVDVLDLSSTKVTAAGLRELEPLVNLRELVLRNANPGVHLEGIAGLKNLRQVSLLKSEMTTAAVAGLARAKKVHLLPAARNGVGKPAAQDADIVTLDLRAIGVTDWVLEPLTALPNLRHVDLPEGPMTDKRFTKLREAGLVYALPQARDKNGKRPTRAADLYTLDLSDVPVTVHVLGDLAEEKALRLLEFNRKNKKLGWDRLPIFRVTGTVHLLPEAQRQDGTRPVKDEEIQKLDLSAWKLTRESLWALEDYPELCEVDLRENVLKEEWLTMLKGCKKLHTLKLPRNVLSDDGFAALKEAGLLQALSPHAEGKDKKRPTKPEEALLLDLEGVWVGDAALRAVVTLKNLEKLDLRRTKVSGEGLIMLKTLTKLQELKLDRPLLQREEAAKLKAMLPKLKILQ